MSRGGRALYPLHKAFCILVIIFLLKRSAPTTSILPPASGALSLRLGKAVCPKRPKGTA